MSSYKKNLVFTAACIGMCFFGISMITLGSVLPSLTAKLGLDNLQATALVTFLPLGLDYDTSPSRSSALWCSEPEVTR